ncbi:TetR/AcrR family transcriptional regulator [Longispora albida]|uniref:TetR/AcrR family transcriptional regulator n=1 Tax=Longispora albida TaxID=203523 RepID=UPI00037E9B8E|nr:TetR/AcrR family transcriptional regulator [Longispora albida]
MSTGDTAERIAAAARELLLAEGAAAVSMRRVAQAAGITPMAIYTHFPNRDALLRAVAGRAFAELAGFGVVSGSDARAKIGDLLERFLDFALGAPHLYTFLLTDQRPGARRFPDGFRDGSSPTFTVALELVEAGMREGSLREDDPLEVTLALTTSVQGLVQQYLGGRIGLPEAEFRALCARTIERIIHGLGA